MPAAPASGIVYGGAVRAVEFGSTGVLAPSDSPLGRVSTSLPLGPPEGDCELSTESSQSPVCMQIVESILKVFGLDVASRSRSSTRQR